MLSRPFENGHPIGGTPPTQLLNCPVPPAVLIAMTPRPSSPRRPRLSLGDFCLVCLSITPILFKRVLNPPLRSGAKRGGGGGGGGRPAKCSLNLSIVMKS